MELRLSEELQEGLCHEAASLGTTVEEIASHILAQHNLEWRRRQGSKADDRAGKVDAYIAWMKSRSSDYEKRDPYAVDWQLVKAEGRRY